MQEYCFCHFSIQLWFRLNQAVNKTIPNKKIYKLGDFWNMAELQNVTPAFIISSH